MKKYLTFLLLLLCLQSCKAQIINNKLENNLKKDTMRYPIVTKDFETFNNYQYENRKDKNSSFLEEFLKDGTYIEMLKSESGNVYRETPKDSYFTITKGYYINNNIHGKGLFFNAVGSGGFQKGTWYEFDEQGNLIKEIDYDKFYKFTFEDILKFCEREKIKISKGPVLYSTGWHNDILREYSPISGQATWTIEWLKETDTIQTIKIDGTTGQVLSRTDAHYINN